MASIDKIEVELCRIGSTDEIFPRKFTLTPESPRMIIGRSSKRHGTTGSPRVDNAYFVSAVISRTHAELKFNTSSKTLQIKDKGSLHGTILNRSSIDKDVWYTVVDGDEITIGSTVALESRSILAKSFSVHIKYLSASKGANPTLYKMGSNIIDLCDRAATPPQPKKITTIDMTTPPLPPPSNRNTFTTSNESAPKDGFQVPDYDSLDDEEIIHYPKVDRVVSASSRESPKEISMCEYPIMRAMAIDYDNDEPYDDDCADEGVTSLVDESQHNNQAAEEDEDEGEDQDEDYYSSEHDSDSEMGYSSDPDGNEDSDISEPHSDLPQNCDFLQSLKSAMKHERDNFDDDRSTYSDGESLNSEQQDDEDEKSSELDQVNDRVPCSNANQQKQDFGSTSGKVETVSKPTSNDNGSSAPSKFKIAQESEMTIKGQIEKSIQDDAILGSQTSSVAKGSSEEKRSDPLKSANSFTTVPQAKVDNPLPLKAKSIEELTGTKAPGQPKEVSHQAASNATRLPSEHQKTLDTNKSTDRNTERMNHPLSQLKAPATANNFNFPMFPPSTQGGPFFTSNSGVPTPNQLYMGYGPSVHGPPPPTWLDPCPTEYKMSSHLTPHVHSNSSNSYHPFFPRHGIPQGPWSPYTYNPMVQKPAPPSPIRPQAPNESYSLPDNILKKPPGFDERMSKVQESIREKLEACNKRLHEPTPQHDSGAKLNQLLINKPVTQPQNPVSASKTGETLSPSSLPVNKSTTNASSEPVVPASTSSASKMSIANLTTSTSTDNASTEPPQGTKRKADETTVEVTKPAETSQTKIDEARIPSDRRHKIEKKVVQLAEAIKARDERRASEAAEPPAKRARVETPTTTATPSNATKNPQPARSTPAKRSSTAKSFVAGALAGGVGVLGALMFLPESLL